MRNKVSSKLRVFQINGSQGHLTKLPLTTHGSSTLMTRYKSESITKSDGWNAGLEIVCNLRLIYIKFHKGAILSNVLYTKHRLELTTSYLKI